MERTKEAVSVRGASTAGPESSLTWCLSQLHKAEAMGGEDRSGDSDAKDAGGAAKVKEGRGGVQPGLWRALVAIRTRHIKGGSAGIARYRASGGLQPLLKLLQPPACARKTLDLVLSILANCCTESETRVEVRKLGGISIVVDVLKNVAVETVQNRAARALGNLAIDSENSTLIHRAGGVPPLLLCLSPLVTAASPPTLHPTSPVPVLECAQSAARALLYLSDTPANRLSLLSHGALPALLLLIAPEYPSGLRRAALRTLGELTKGCSAECVREVSKCGALAQLGALASGDSAQPLAEMALKILANLCSQGCLRPLIGSLGVVQKFVEEVKKDPPKSGMFFRALCLCCKEAVNRVKVKDSGGLEVLINFLAVNQSHPFARLAVLAFVDFVYDESALEQLQGWGLVPLLVARLVELAKGGGLGAGETDMPVPPSLSSELLPTSCFESFDFPHPEPNRKEEGGKEQGQESSSFLSLRSWLLSEGLISCEGELLSPPGSVEGELESHHHSFSPTTPLSDRLSSPLTRTSPSTTPGSEEQTSTPSPLVGSSALSVPASCHKTWDASPANPPTSTPLPHLSSASHKSTPSSPRRKLPSVPFTSPQALVPPQTPPASARPPPYHHPYHPEPWTPESPILLLLSRFSQSVDPSSALINPGTISGLLYYLTRHLDPNGRCFRLLCRLSCNPNCLEGLVRTGAVAVIQCCLCLGAGTKQSGRVKAKVRQLGKTVLSNLHVQCESAFGSGMLTHIMLSGSDTDRLYCSLTLPLINSNKLLLKKLLLDHGGLKLALEPLGCHDDGEDHMLGWWGSLSSWLYPPRPVSSSRLCTLYFSLLTECLSTLFGCPKMELDRDVEFTPRSGEKPRSSLISKTQRDVPPPTKKQRVAHTCPYLDSNFDLMFLLDDGSQVPANMEAVAGSDEGEVGSEYFRALLRGGFGEAKQNAGQGILIRDVTMQMLLPVLHYLHGCCLDAGERRVIKGREVAGNWDEETATSEEKRRGGRCLVLGSLTSEGLGEWKQGGEVKTFSEGNHCFQKTPLAEAMEGACRFLVSGLQRELEDLCVSLLLSLAASETGKDQSSKDTEKQVVPDMDRNEPVDETKGIPVQGSEPGKLLRSKSRTGFGASIESSTQSADSVPQVKRACKAKLTETIQCSQVSFVPAGVEGASAKQSLQQALKLKARTTRVAEPDHSQLECSLGSRLVRESGKGLALELLSGCELERAQWSGLSVSGLPLDRVVKDVVYTSADSNATDLKSAVLRRSFSRLTESEAGVATVLATCLKLSSTAPATFIPETAVCSNPGAIAAAKLGPTAHSQVEGLKSNAGSESFFRPASDRPFVSGIDPSVHSPFIFGLDSESAKKSSFKLKLDQRKNSRSQLLPLSGCMPSCSCGCKLEGMCLDCSRRGSAKLDKFNKITLDPRLHSVPNSESFSVSALKAGTFPVPKSGLNSKPKLESVSDPELDPEVSPKSSLRLDPASATDSENWPLVMCLPQLYGFSQRHSYTHLGQMCLSVLLRPQGTTSRLPTSLAADCLCQLTRKAHCTQTLKQDLLTLATQALS